MNIKHFTVAIALAALSACTETEPDSVKYDGQVHVKYAGHDNSSGSTVVALDVANYTDDPIVFVACTVVAFSYNGPSARSDSQRLFTFADYIIDGSVDLESGQLKRGAVITDGQVLDVDEVSWRCTYQVSGQPGQESVQAGVRL